MEVFIEMFPDSLRHFISQAELSIDLSGCLLEDPHALDYG